MRGPVAAITQGTLPGFQTKGVQVSVLQEVCIFTIHKPVVYGNRLHWGARASQLHKP